MSNWRIKSLLLTIMILTTIQGVSADAPTQSQELITNGGFESGMQGWSAVNAQAVTSIQQGLYDASTHTPHSGQYSAQVGSANQPGTLSQTVTIPSKSKVSFTAWYRLEQGASIRILLKRSDGSTIQQWSGSGSEWTLVTYDLDPSFAGQTITVEFDGQGNALVQSYAGLCGYRFGIPSYCLYQAESDYFPFVDDVSMVATLAQYTSNVNVNGIPQALSTKLYVDDAQTDILSGGQSRQLAFTIGETHKISIDNPIYQDNTTRYYCNSTSTTVTTDSQVAFSFRKQYYLTITSPYGTPIGMGWYDEDSKANFSITGTVPMPGLLGMFGAKYTFDKWNGGETPNNLQNSIPMSGPRTVSATWKADYTALYLPIAAVALAIVAALLGYRRLIERREKSQRTAVYEDRDGVVVDVPHVEGSPTQVRESEPTQVKEDQTTQVKEEPTQRVESEATEQKP
jgi:hypothetical protein